MNKKVVELIRWMKDNEIVRALAFPFRIIERKVTHEKYLKSEEPFKLSGIKNSHKGEECYIIGNGPSLLITDLEKLIGKDTFASNEIFSLFNKTQWRPKYYSTYDPDVFQLYSNILRELDMDMCFFNIDGKKYIKKDKKNAYYFYSYVPYVINKAKSTNPFISEDITKRISDGRTITFVNIQIAIYMGYKTIYLIGMDHSFSKTYEKDGKIHEYKDVIRYVSGIQDVTKGIHFPDSMDEAFKVAKTYCDEHQINIYNITRGGNLEIFERKNTDDIIERK